MSVDSSHQEIRDVLKKHQLRVTAQRVAVMSLLRERKSPVTHEQVMGFLGPDT